MHLNPKLGVCPICHNESGDILLRTLPNGNIRLFNGQDDGPRHQLSPNPCPTCQAQLDDDRVALVPVKSTSSTSSTVSTEHFHKNRVGDEIAWLKRSAFTRIFNQPCPSSSVIAIEPEVLTLLKDANNHAANNATD